MSVPGVGDVITTAEELDALPRSAAVVMADVDGSLLAVRDNRYWHSLGMDPLTSADLFDISVDPEEGGPIPVTLVYLPGRPPRPERVVKAEALNEACNDLLARAETLRLQFTSRVDLDWLPAMAVQASVDPWWLHDRARRVEQGES